MTDDLEKRALALGVERRDLMYLTSRELDSESALRKLLPPHVRDGSELYVLMLDGQTVGVTDEYGTCHWAAGGRSKAEVEHMILRPDGTPRDGVIVDEGES